GMTGGRDERFASERPGSRSRTARRATTASSAGVERARDRPSTSPPARPRRASPAVRDARGSGDGERRVSPPGPPSSATFPREMRTQKARATIRQVLVAIVAAIATLIAVPRDAQAAGVFKLKSTEVNEVSGA